MLKILGMPAPEIMGDRIAFCIGIYETNRGGDKPIPKESDLDTVAGIKASMATNEQATMDYALDKFLQFEELRKAAVPALTVSELRAGIACCKAVEKLLREVQSAKEAGSAPSAFIAAEAKLIQSAFVDAIDVGTMFDAETLRKRVFDLHELVKKGKIKLDDAVKSIPKGDRMGIGGGSLKAYIRKTGNWGENRAAWKRLAVGNMPDALRDRLETVATSGDGDTIAKPVSRSRVAAALKQNPRISETDLVLVVAQQNNPGEAGYADNVLAIYNRLYPGAKALTSMVARGNETDLLERFVATLTKAELKQLARIVKERKKAL